MVEVKFDIFANRSGVIPTEGGGGVPMYEPDDGPRKTRVEYFPSGMGTLEKHISERTPVGLEDTHLVKADVWGHMQDEDVFMTTTAYRSDLTALNYLSSYGCTVYGEVDEEDQWYSRPGSGPYMASCEIHTHIYRAYIRFHKTDFKHPVLKLGMYRGGNAAERWPTMFQVFYQDWDNTWGANNQSWVNPNTLIPATGIITYPQEEATWPYRISTRHIAMINTEHFAEVNGGLAIILNGNDGPYISPPYEEIFTSYPASGEARGETLIHAAASFPGISDYVSMYEQ